jgi:hypothetical protein
MKIISGLNLFKKPSASRHKPAFCFALVLTAALSFTGCSKKPAVAEAPAPQPALDTNQNKTAAAPVVPEAAPVVPEATPVAPEAPAVIAASPNGGANLSALNQAYIGWVIQNHHHAKSFEEYVAASGISVPPPPAGKKYIIDKNGFINYANN